MQEIEHPVLKVNDNLYVHAAMEKVGYSILLSCELPTLEKFNECKTYAFYTKDCLVALFYKDENDIIGSLCFIEMKGLSLYAIMSTAWQSEALYIWEYYKRAEVISDEDGRTKIHFKPSTEEK